MDDTRDNSKTMAEQAAEFVTDALGKGEDKIDDLWAKVTDTRSRAGNVVDRVATMLAEDVHPIVIAAQLTTSSAISGKNHVYTPEFVIGVGNLHDDCTATQPVPKRVCKALVADRRALRGPRK